MTGATLTAAASHRPRRRPGAGRRPTQASRGHTASSAGQIVDAQSGRPIAGATYEITGPEDSASGTTDDNGRFETRPIKAGTYTMVARAKGYVWGGYGALRVTPFGAPIDVRAGRVSSGIDIRLSPPAPSTAASSTIAATGCRASRSSSSP